MLPKLPREVTRLLQDCDGRYESNLQRINSRFSPEAPAKLVHYTSFESCLKIVESGCLFISDIRSMRDQMEIEHGVRFFVLAAYRLAQRASSDVREIFNYLQALYEEVGARNFARFYISCFSFDPHDDFKWKSFADERRGCALEFDGELLEQQLASLDVGVTGAQRSSFPMSYSHQRLLADQKTLAAAFVAAAEQLALHDLKGRSRKEAIRHLVIQTLVYATSAAILYKQPRFRKEQEYRFLFASRGDIPVPAQRTRGAGQIPFLELKWRSEEKNSLKRIIVGENAPLNAEHLVRMRLDSAGLRSVVTSRYHS